MEDIIVPKWPRQIDLIRHGESTYNKRTREQLDLPLYQDFMAAFANDPDSAETQKLAKMVFDHYRDIAGDSDSPITNVGRDKMIALGQQLATDHQLPDLLFVSPYRRTKQSLAALIKGWPELAKVRIIEDDRLREREFGLRILYGDRRVFDGLHPEQRQLRELQGDYWYRPPQGENIPDVRQRMRQWTSSLIGRHGGKRVMAITHHIAILAFRANIERLTGQQYVQLYDQFEPNNGSLTTYRGEINTQTGMQRLRLIKFSA